MNTHPVLGQLIPVGTRVKRDAIHVAVVPLTAGTDSWLRPGEAFWLDSSGCAVSAVLAGAGPLREPVGLVDPFLRMSVRPGEGFWGLLPPGVVTNLRHDFDHPAFSAAEPAVVVREVPAPEDPEITRLRAWMKAEDLSVDDVIGDVTENREANDSGCRGC